MVLFVFHFTMAHVFTLCLFGQLVLVSTFTGQLKPRLTVFREKMSIQKDLFRSMNTGSRKSIKMGGGRGDRRLPFGDSFSFNRRSSQLYSTPLSDNIPTPTSLKEKAQSLPLHPKLKQGVLSNGLQYVVLSNTAPKGRFEAHLEILAGSADEKENQQGMAHVVEHIAYMGNRKRELLFGTGSQTNAYTDFHHTVYFANCPVADPDFPADKKVMLSRALNTLTEVIQARFDDDRLKKERKAVLSEMTMVNTIDYRIECEILKALHAENIMASRFPIGVKDQIENWTIQDVKKFHSEHYKPEKAFLYLVGDMDTDEMENQIKQTFGTLPSTHTADGNAKRESSLNHASFFPSLRSRSATMSNSLRSQQPTSLSPSTATSPISLSSLDGSYSPSLKLQSRHFPPVVHHWCGGGDQFDKTSRIPTAYSNQMSLGFKSKSVLETAQMTSSTPLVEEATSVAVKALRNDSCAGILRIFSHDMISRVSFHLFAKRPIRPLLTRSDFKQSLAIKFALSALQIRLNVMSRNEPIFNYVEFNEQDASREASRVCSLDMMCETLHWQSALEIVLKSMQALAKYGLTPSEVSRFKRSILSEAEQLAAQGDSAVSSNLVTALMDSFACGHIFMQPQDHFEITKQALDELTSTDINRAAYELGAHVMDDFSKHPSAFVVCTPSNVQISESMIESIFRKIRSSAVDKPDLSAVTVPNTLLPLSTLPPQYQSEKLASNVIRQHIVSSHVVGKGPRNETTVVLPKEIVMNKLRNGLSFNYRCSDDEPQRASMKMVISGGRLAEASNHNHKEGTAMFEQIKPLKFQVPFGALMLAAKTMQEGGSLGNLSRTHVELFCVDQLVMVEISASDEFLEFNFNCPTVQLSGEESVSGLESLFQIVRSFFLLAADTGDKNAFNLEQDAMERAVAMLVQLQETEATTLEGSAKECLMQKMTRQDNRFKHVTEEQLKALTLDDLKNTIKAFLQLDKVSISMCGDFEPLTVEELAVKYWGSLPSPNKAIVGKNADILQAAEQAGMSLQDITSFRKNNVDGKQNVIHDWLLSPFRAPVVEMDTHAELQIKDSDPRALCLVSGISPNQWGYDNKGNDIRHELGVLPLSVMDEKVSAGYQMDMGRSIELSSLPDNVRRAQPTWSAACLALLQELINRRLFSQVREKKGLTYDANFQINAHERVGGGHWLVSVTCSLEATKLAQEAAVQTLIELSDRSPFSVFDLSSCRNTLENRFLAEKSSNKNWVEWMSRSQLSSVPWLQPGQKSAGKYDWIPTLKAVTLADINMVLKTLHFNKKEMFTCIAKSGTSSTSTHQSSESVNGEDLNENRDRHMHRLR